MELIVTVSEHLALHASTVTRQANTLCLRPSDPPLFDQLCAWLDQRPSPTVGFNHWVLAIGATALCLRWGTYLAVLMDETKPVDPRARHPATSMISDEEMRRINIEAASNLAHLLRLRHQDEQACFDRLRRAYEWLPMPERRVKRMWEPLELILGTLVGIHQANNIILPESAQTAVSHPYRTLANAIIHFAYRNGPIEDSHAGAGSLLTRSTAGVLPMGKRARLSGMRPNASAHLSAPCHCGMNAWKICRPGQQEWPGCPPGDNIPTIGRSLNPAPRFS
ncbi:MAG: hypothetical protein L0332_13695 [Chloroflexi bacterium]|nr:hypothetical protein [Chloroflexota bacterium]MCI0645576.1 hypothetical protein [Chloroflexota bacterium]MCI0727757.1 hypothetical protein [Chloroflexota bacterium]